MEKILKPNVAGEYVSFVAHHAVPKAMTLVEIGQPTLKDNVSQAVTQAIQRDVRNELTVTVQRIVLHSCYHTLRSSRGC